MAAFSSRTGGARDPLRPTRRELLGGAAGASLASAGLVAPARASVTRRLPVRGGRLQDGRFAAAVTSSHGMASEAGIAMLRAGGTAADAAVAMAAVLSVVEPYFSHCLGGGAWSLYFDAENEEVTSLDGVGPVGSLCTLEDYAARAGDRGMHQANVPGAWDGWMLWLERYGRLDLPEVLAPAIAAAGDGFAVSGEMAYYMSLEYDAMLAHGPTAAVYAPNGSFPGAGQIMTMPGMAATFEALAAAYTEAGSRRRGLQAARDHMYRGPLAEAIVAESDADNGYLTLDDFAGFEAEIVPALSITYGSTMEVYQSPPNSQGMTMLLALNILKGMDHSGMQPHDPDVVHSQVEAVKLAYADRYRFIGDPAVVDVDVDFLLSDEHAAEQLERIDMDRAMPWPDTAGVTQMEPMNTTTYQVVDSYGNAATVTTSLGLQFWVMGDTGIHINERNRFYSVEEGNPNAIAPGKKVRHTSCPYLVLREGRPFVLGGNTGVDTQPQAQLQQLMSAIDFGLSAQGAIGLPRWVSTAFPASTHPWQIGNTLQLQNGFPEGAIAELRNRGHELVLGEGIFGTAAMIKVSADGTETDLGVEPNNSTASGMRL